MTGHRRSDFRPIGRLEGLTRGRKKIPIFHHHVPPLVRDEIANNGVDSLPTDPSGQVVMSVKFGARPIEFEKGKAGVVVSSKDKLPAAIDTLITAVRAGELDELFS